MDRISNQLVKLFFSSLFIFFLSGGGDPFGGGGPFQGTNMNMDDIFKQFFGDRAGGFSSYGGGGFQQAQAQVRNIFKKRCTL